MVLQPCSAAVARSVWVQTVLLDFAAGIVVGPILALLNPFGP